MTCGSSGESELLELLEISNVQKAALMAFLSSAVTRGPSPPSVGIAQACRPRQHFLPVCCWSVGCEDARRPSVKQSGSHAPSPPPIPSLSLVGLQLKTLLNYISNSLDFFFQKLLLFLVKEGLI